MRLTIVGPAAAYSTRPGRASSCYLVEHEGTAIVLEFGQGSFSELWRQRSPATLAAIFISHMHADHNVDLIPLRHWVRFENRGYGPSLFGPGELRRRFGGFQADAEFFSDFSGQVLERRTFPIGDLAVEANPVTHIRDSWAFRVTGADASSRGLVYSGDCGVADDLLPLVHEGDTLLCEAAFGVYREAPDIHLTASEAASVAKRAGAARLILTHLLDRNDPAVTLEAARASFDGPVEIAEPGLTIDIR